MLRNRRLTVFVLVIALLSFLCGAHAHATENQVGFFVTPELPINQVNKEVGFFSLLMQPGQEQTLRVFVTNENTVDIQVAIEINDAFTNQHGVIDYSMREQDQKSLGVSLSQLVTVIDPVLRVPANGLATARLHVQMPQEPFAGELLGGILFSRIPDETKPANEEKAVGGIQILNVFRYCVAIQVTQDTEQTIFPDFRIANARIDTMAGFPTLLLDIENLKPIIAIGAALNAAIYPLDAEEPVLSFESPLSMAPGTSTSFGKLLIGEEFLAFGDYRVKGTLHYGELSWPFELLLADEQHHLR